MAKKPKLDIVSVLQEHGAILTGHFQLPSGLHSPTYVQTSLVMQYPHLAQKIAKSLADMFDNAVDVVLAPTSKTVLIAQEVARVKKARSIFAERINGITVLKRGFTINEGERILVVDDVSTTGRLCHGAISLASRYGAKVIGVSVIVDRSSGNMCLNVPVRALLSYPLEVYHCDECPLCSQGIALSKPDNPFTGL